jgi:hypothetical protein
MKTTDFTAKVTSHQLNEAMFKKFGTRINFESYEREELEKYRNLLRTKIHQTESSARFNDLLSNDTYQKDKHMLELLNTRIKEMLGEGAKVDRQAKHITASMMKKGKSKDDAEAIAWAHIKHPKKKKKAEEGIEENTMKNTKEALDPVGVHDGDVNNNKKKNDKSDQYIEKRRAAISKAVGAKTKESVGDDRPASKKKEVERTLPSGAKVKATTVTGWQTQKGDKAANKEKKKNDEMAEGLPMKKVNGKMVPAFAADGKGKNDLSKKKKSVKEEVFRLHVRLVNESLRFLIKEDEEGKAKAITAASDMVNDFTTWMQRVGQYQTKSMIELADAIRAEFGQAESEAFKNAVAPALSSTIETLTAQREAISHAVAVLAGEATDMAAMGGDNGMDAGEFGGTEVPADTDSMNEPAPDMGDEFAASDAAAGGAETAGRMTRESRQNVKFRQIAESHSIMSRLAR